MSTQRQQEIALQIAAEATREIRESLLPQLLPIAELLATQEARVRAGTTAIDAVLSDAARLEWAQDEGAKLRWLLLILHDMRVGIEQMGKELA